MALPSSGSISLSQVNVELKKSATAAISMGDSAVRVLAKRTSGAIAMSDLRGKSAEVRFVNATNRTQANIHTLMGRPTAATTYIFENTATISAASRGGWALQTGSFPAGSTLRIINRGAIRGGGGNGGNGVTTGTGGSGGSGGSALVLNFPTTIDNTGGTIWGGGGGGGAAADFGAAVGGGGGAGVPAGAGGTGAASGGAGGAGSSTAGGAGGYSGLGGSGGGPGAAGSAGTSGGSRAGAGGRGGYSVQRNSNAVTWAAVGDRRGSVV